MDETGETVLYRSEDVVGSFVADGAEKRLESRTRYKCNVTTEQTNGGLFTERPRCALKCDPRATICRLNVDVASSSLDSSRVRL
jgi:hypothetical protein